MYGIGDTEEVDRETASIAHGTTRSLCHSCGIESHKRNRYVFVTYHTKKNDTWAYQIEVSLEPIVIVEK